MLIHLTEESPRGNGFSTAISFGTDNPTMLGIAGRDASGLTKCLVFRETLSDVLAGVPFDSPLLGMTLVPIDGHAVLRVATPSNVFYVSTKQARKALDLSYGELTPIEESITTPKSLDAELERILNDEL